MGEKRLRVLPNGVRWCRNWDKNVCAIWWEKILETICSTFFVFNTCIFVNRFCLACIVVTKCVFVYLICICSTLCVFVVLCVYCCSYFRCRDCWLEVSIRKVLRPATSTQVFLGFPVSTSKC